MTTWTPKTKQSEAWTEARGRFVFSPLVFSNYPVFDTMPGLSRWTDRVQQAEAWTNFENPLRVFSPLVFSLHPVFDTGRASGVWTDRVKQPEVWAEV